MRVTALHLRSNGKSPFLGLPDGGIQGSGCGQLSLSLWRWRWHGGDA
jgi:hypothetical protein